MIKLTVDMQKAFKNTPWPAMAERDMLECQILSELFNDDYFARNFKFSGGGSISKSYNLTMRQNSDIDLACCDFEDLSLESSHNQLNKFKKKFKEYVFNDVYRKLNHVINKNKQFLITTDEQWKKLISRKNPNTSPTLHLVYESLFEPKLGHVSIEIIPRKYPSQIIKHQTVVPYSINQGLCTIPTVAFEQTFWDKIHALHSLSVRENPRYIKHISRHHYDVSAMAGQVDLDNTKHLFHDVVNYQRIYTTRNIPYTDTFNQIRLLPLSDGCDKLEQDYKKMSETLLDKTLDWQSIQCILNQLNNRINQL